MRNAKQKRPNHPLNWLTKRRRAAAEIRRECAEEIFDKRLSTQGEVDIQSRPASTGPEIAVLVDGSIVGRFRAEQLHRAIFHASVLAADIRASGKTPTIERRHCVEHSDENCAQWRSFRSQLSTEKSSPIQVKRHEKEI